MTTNPATRAFTWIIATIGALATLALAIAPKFLIPAEDVIILLQFSRNLAHTGAIAWLPGGIHAEGATDFLWMVYLALGIKLGLDAFVLIALTNVASLLALAILLLKIANARIRPLPVFFIAGAFALMPQFFAAAVGFSTLPFAALLVLLTLCFLRQRDIATPAVAFLLCLFRPDGVIFALPLLIAALILYPARLRRLALDATFFILPGLLYFAWRWHYFGQLLPLPFLVKSDVAHRTLLFFSDYSLRQGKLLCLFALATLWLPLRHQLRDPSTRAVFLSLLILPNFFYFAMRLDQNFGHRFFIYLPVGVAVLIAMHWPTVRPQFPCVLLVALGAWTLFLSRLWIPIPTDVWRRQHDNRKAIAQALATLPRGTVIVTEAGFVPYYSHWNAFDAWGLNTPRFSRTLFQPSDVAQIHPDLLLVYTGYNTCLPQPGWHTPYNPRTWENMTRNVIAGAPAPQYDLWFVPAGNTLYRQHRHLQTWQGDQECWFIAHDTPLRPALETIFTTHGGHTAAQYATLNPPAPAPPQPSHQSPWHRGPLYLVKASIKKLWHLLDE